MLNDDDDDDLLVMYFQWNRVPPIMIKNEEVTVTEIYNFIHNHFSSGAYGW